MSVNTLHMSFEALSKSANFYNEDMQRHTKYFSFGLFLNLDSELIFWISHK